jgi:5'-nucleotidase
MKALFRSLVLVCVAGLLGACASVATDTSASRQAPTVAVRLLAFNDFHGALRTPNLGIIDEKGTMVRAGGAAHLATAIKQLSTDPARTVVVGAGDLIGATPLISALFDDEPTIETLTAIGLQISSVGNHEFDRGWRELQRHQNGGCRKEGPCHDREYRGAGFRYLAANVIEVATGKPAFPAYEVRMIDGIPVAFIGAVLKGTTTVVPESALVGLRFMDEAEAINALVPELIKQGVQTIAVLIHEGGRTSGHYNDATCPEFIGPIVPIVKALHPAIDVVVSGHSHQAYVCKVGNALVTSASSNGRLLTAIDLTIDRASRDVTAASARNIIVDTARFAADPAIEARIARYGARSAPLENRIVGRIAGEITMMPTRAGEMPMGNLIADAQLAATRSVGAQIAFMNRGGVRAPLLATRPEGAVTFADVYTVQPFANMLTTMDLTGAQIARLLEQQWTVDPSAPTRIMQVSANFTYAWDARQPFGKRVVQDSIKVDGMPLDPNRVYRITCNSFIAEGAEFFTVFTEGKNRVVSMVDVDALEAYIAKNSPVRAPATGRIARVD